MNAIFPFCVPPNLPNQDPQCPVQSWGEQILSEGWERRIEFVFLCKPPAMALNPCPLFLASLNLVSSKGRDKERCRSDTQIWYFGMGNKEKTCCKKRNSPPPAHLSEKMSGGKGRKLGTLVQIWNRSEFENNVSNYFAWCRKLFPALLHSYFTFTPPWWGRCF